MGARVTKIVNNLIEFPNPVNSWLDIGTGDGKVVFGLKWCKEAKLKVAFDPVFKNCGLVGGWEKRNTLSEALDRCCKYDLFTAFDVIEHMEKDAGRLLIENMQKRSKFGIIWTPDGFLRQDEKSHPKLLKENPYQLHKCGWERAEFEQMGLYVRAFVQFHRDPDSKYRRTALLATWGE